MSNEDNKQSNNKGCTCAIIISIIIILLIAISLIIVFTLDESEEKKESDDNSSNNNTIIENTPHLFTRNANNNDISLNRYKESLLEIQYTFIPKVDIKNLQLTIRIKDEDNNVINTQVKNLGNVIEGNQYFFSLSLTELSISGYFDANYISITTTGGTVSFFD